MTWADLFYTIAIAALSGSWLLISYEQRRMNTSLRDLVDRDAALQRQIDTLRHAHGLPPRRTSAP